MEKQEKKTVKHLSNEEIAKALEALKGTPLPTDIEPFLGDLSKRSKDLFKKN